MTSTTRRRRRRCGALAVGVVLAMIVGACSDDDDAAGEESSSSTTEAAATTTTQPPGTEPADVQPYIEDLVVEAADVRNEIGQDPTVVLDRNSDLVARFRALHTPDSEDVEPALETYEAHAAAGRRLEPVVPGEPGVRQEVVGTVRTADEDVVEFDTCTHYNRRVIDQAGVMSELLEGISHPGRGTAERIDGVWLIQHIGIDDTQLCAPGQEA